MDHDAQVRMFAACRSKAKRPAVVVTTCGSAAGIALLLWLDEIAEANDSSLLGMAVYTAGFFGFLGAYGLYDRALAFFATRAERNYRADSEDA